MLVWNQDEFEILRARHALSDADLVELLHGRSLGAIGVVRTGLHSFHEGRDASMLSQLMIDKLRGNPGKTTCPRCGMVF